MSEPLGPKLHELVTTERDPKRRAALEEVLAWARKVLPDFRAACGEILQARASLGLGPDDGPLATRAGEIRVAAARVLSLSERGAAGALRPALGRETEHGLAVESLLSFCGIEDPAKSGS